MVRTFRSTRLDALNEMLSTIGEAPVSSLGQPTADVLMALNVLDGVEREVQSYGWHFNTEFSVTFLPNASGEFPVPADIIAADPRPGRYSNREIVLRAGRLYDLAHSTYVLTESSIVADIVRFLEFEEMPEQARRLCTLRAARMFQNRVAPNRITHVINREDEQAAWIALVKYEAEQADWNYLRDTLVRRILARGRVPVSSDLPFAGDLPSIPV